MKNWKDATSYSRDDADRTPRTWSLEVGNIRIIVTRKWWGKDAGGYSPWFIECAPFLNVGPLDEDVEAVKKTALALLKTKLTAHLSELEEKYMKRSLISHGNTYCGKSGLPRTVKEMGRTRQGRMYINYSRPDGTEGGCFIEAFMSWATGFHNPEAQP